LLRYYERRPPPELRRQLECLWSVSDTSVRPHRDPERVVPDGCPELIVHLGDPFARRIGKRWVVQPRIFLAGTLTRPWLLRAGSRVRTIGVRFRPGAAAMLFRISMANATDRELPLSDLVGPAAAKAFARLVRSPQTEARRFSAIEEWLVARLAGTHAHRGRAGHVVDLILRTRGQARIDAIAQSLGWSPRRIERAFLREIGVRPKLYARIVRLNAVLAKLDATERASAVDLALEAGYFDQAHLLRDFRLLAGRTPRVGREDDGEMSRHFTRPERLRALLAGE
jgi:AraC-like DNA-binding protein